MSCGYLTTFTDRYRDFHHRLLGTPSSWGLPGTWGVQPCWRLRCLCAASPRGWVFGFWGGFLARMNPCPDTRRDSESHSAGFEVVPPKKKLSANSARQGSRGRPGAEARRNRLTSLRGLNRLRKKSDFRFGLTCVLYFCAFLGCSAV
jgi:hypothetical protein